ncbi:putative oxidoreductase [Gordonia araii NBRC 100433]|uniref:Putative oxidoreductase n=1 Tax=Gordonia araii NBRC 100433 TaxID=1073574 RepID=G7GXA4_9ACTN|nr:NAD(P)/FAD-dependent oxidoreductase [Gordonia araii]NNG99002.1 NAD(P)/FAD-dependent oxidoreductase [Gordonia araii NBRC 100433]GAB08229.1 putative oxidoreductase [Gordonia araii NBRC 100433]
MATKTASRSKKKSAEEADHRPPIKTGVVIIGSGFSGLGMGIALKKDGRDDFVILEKAGDVGGTWRDNTYPGAACDVPTHLYSYSFEPRSNWERLWSYQPEIFNYLKEVSDKYGLGPHLRFHQVAERGYWDEDEMRWHLWTADGQEYVAQFVVSAIGALHIPSIPEIDGIENFGGHAFHSAQWDHSVDLTGKKVAVIGTGASAIQFVPEIVDKVDELQLYQRTPAWVLPRENVNIPAAAQRAFARIPGLRRVFRSGMYWGAEAGAYALNNRPALLKTVELIGKAHIRRQIDDKELRAKLTPDYRPGCKRLLGSNTYYQALNLAKSEVITDSITGATADGLVTADGRERPADVIIYGTGFHVTDSFESLSIKGKGGADLIARFREEGPMAHRGITVADMPNAFFLLGPNTGLGHTSIVFMIESQIHYVRDAIRMVDQRGVDAIMPRSEVQSAYNEDLQRRLAGSVWNTGGCQSWYLDEHGNNRTLWPGYTWRYWLSTRRVRPQEYEFLARPGSTPTPASDPRGVAAVGA